MAEPLELTRTHRILIGLVVAGAVIIAGIGFAGSYAAVRELALAKGFGNFSYVFPIGIDAGICVLLALDLLLTWIRIPFPLLRQTAWLLTLATIAFNGAAAWPDPLGVGMHSVIPVLFVVSVEAARHAVGRIADITADKHMEGVRLTRWLLSPLPTFLLWRRMKLWELRSYDQVIRLEQDRLVYQARLRSRFGRAWRRKAPVESLMPLRLARYGVPLAETAPAGLAAAGIEPAVLPAAEAKSTPIAPTAPAPALDHEPERQLAPAPSTAPPQHRGPDRPAPANRGPAQRVDEHGNPWFKDPQPQKPYAGGYDPTFEPDERYEDEDGHRAPRRAESMRPEDLWRDDLWPEDPEASLPDDMLPPYPEAGFPGTEYVQPEPPRPGFHVPAGPNQTRPLGHGTVPGPRTGDVIEQAPDDAVLPHPEGEPTGVAGDDERSRFPEGMSRQDAYYQVFRQSFKAQGSMPTPGSFGADLQSTYSVQESDAALKRYVKSFGERFNTELAEDHIA
ncbi:DUF2637 domain-containing protein [Streptomyces sp. NPDC059816]|uniref:DUF2637 domain-containing protein n=1 Tax=Streptomyces sp. NPDC059816 TaxID=3346960 RepID=UPI003664D6C6